MSQLVIDGLTVKIAVGTELSDEPWGDVARAYSGRMRSDVVAHHRAFRFQTPELDSDDVLALRLVLQNPGPMTCSGDRIGSVESTFHRVGPVRVRPVSPTESVVVFDLHESVDQPDFLLFSFDAYAPGTFTHTRSGSVGPYIDSVGALQSAAANTPRYEYVYTDAGLVAPDLRTLLLEVARTNLNTEDDLTAWSVSGTPVVTGSVADPFGGSDAYSVEDDGGTEYIERAVTYGSDGTKPVVFVVKENDMGTAAYHALQLWDNTASTPRGELRITGWTSGEPTVTAPLVGSYLGKYYVGDGYWALFLHAPSVVAANTNRLRIFPASSGVATLNVYRVITYNDEGPTWSILNESQARNADRWLGTIVGNPQKLTAYVRFIEGGSITIPGAGLLNIGVSGSGASMTVQRDSSTAFYEAVYRNNIDANIQATLTAEAPLIGQLVEIRATIDVDAEQTVDMLTIEQSIAGAATTDDSSGLSSYGGYGSAWSDQQVEINAGPSGSVPGSVLVETAKVWAGSYTMAQARKLASARLHRRVA